MNTPLSYLMLTCLAALPLTTFAGKALESVSPEAIDKVFSESRSPDKPAIAVAVIHAGKVVYQNAYGSANLEYKVPATVDTRFQVEGLALEVIAYATLMLEEQGKIKLDDDIRQYLPKVADFGEKVTIRHLLSSTDGLPGYRTLKSLAGWETGGPEQHKAILRLIQSQKALNFRPGQVFSPNGSTRLILLAHMVETVTGQPFDVYCKAEIFAPLGMANTVLQYDSNLPLANTAVPYRSGADGLYKYDYGNGSAAGPTNLYTSIKDLGIWRAHLSALTIARKPLAKQLNSPIRLDGGAPIKDVASISIYGQLHLGQERGIPKIYQRGSAGGYSSLLFRFPEQDFAVAVLSSDGAYHGSYGMRVANLFMKNQFPEPENIDYTKIKAVKLSPQQLQSYQGSYWNPARAISAKVYLKNDALYYTRVEGTEGYELIPLGNAVFQIKMEGDDTLLLKFAETGTGKTMSYTVGESDPVVYKSYESAAYTQQELTQFAGTFYSKELDASFVVDASNGVLTASNIRSGVVSFRPLNIDRFAGDKRFMGGIRFIRDGRNAVSGFQVVVDEVRNLVFKKVS
ncbi:serine hydrolase [Chitinimonas sp. BJYL2]|uniref:serine hydrolase domain-containing protein n=1 Tax=Chitinimonas sp. BJYL2 TaxID=2976696 RepID=UPI0022B557B3|nr:serine hydrolase domain-containing protein [Chitinimonas sp. BJYL2]